MVAATIIAPSSTGILTQSTDITKHVLVHSATVTGSQDGIEVASGPTVTFAGVLSAGHSNNALVNGAAATSFDCVFDDSMLPVSGWVVEPDPFAGYTVYVSLPTCTHWVCTL